MLKHFLNSVADFGSLQLQRGTNAKRLPNGAEKANIVIGTRNLNVSGEAGGLLTPGPGAERFPNAGGTVNERQCASVPGVVECIKHLLAYGRFRKGWEAGNPLAAVGLRSEERRVRKECR